MGRPIGEELAEYAGMSATNYRRVEHGLRGTTGRERAALARGLGVSLAAMNGTKHRVLNSGLVDEPELS